MRHFHSVVFEKRIWYNKSKFAGTARKRKGIVMEDFENTNRPESEPADFEPAECSGPEEEKPLREPSEAETVRRTDIRLQNKKANWLSLIALILYVILSITLSAINDVSPVSFEAEILASQLVILVPPVIYLILFRKHHPKEHLLQFQRIGAGNTFLLVLLGITMYPILTFINLVSQLFVENVIGSEITSASTSIPFWEMLLLVAIIPALVEETVYRGAYFGTYKRESIVWGAVISGLLFGLMHMNVNQFAYAFVLGFAFAMIDAAVGSLHASMLVHCLYNGFSVCMIYLVSYLEKYLDEETEAGVTEILSDSEATRDSLLLSVKAFLPMFLLGIFLSFLLYRVISMRMGTWEKIKAEFAGKSEGKLRRIVSVPLGITVVLLITILVFVEIQ